MDRGEEKGGSCVGSYGLIQTGGSWDVLLLSIQRTLTTTGCPHELWNEDDEDDLVATCCPSPLVPAALASHDKTHRRPRQLRATVLLSLGTCTRTSLPPSQLLPSPRVSPSLPLAMSNNNGGGRRPARLAQPGGPIRRTSSGSARSTPYGAPYVRPPITLCISPTHAMIPQRGSEPIKKTAVPTTGMWQHDLFPSSSNLYAPTLNMAAPALSNLSPRVSPSLRPFGASTPILHPNGLPTRSEAAAPKAKVLAERLALPIPTGPRSNGPSLDVRGAREATKAKFMEDQRRKEEEKRRKEENLLSKEEYDRVKMVAGEEERGFVVQVAGLVFGTSAEDVQVSPKHP
jgi:hypothetical protein